MPLEVALGRILGGRDALKYYEAGMDLGLSRNVEESFRIFQGRILAEYEAMIEEMGFHVIDATQSIEDQQQQMRAIVMRRAGRQPAARRAARAAPRRIRWTTKTQPLHFYSEPLPGVDTRNCRAS